MRDNLRGAALMTGAMVAFTINDACMKALAPILPLFQSIALRGVLTVLLLSLVVAGRREPVAGGRITTRDRALIALRTVCEMAAAFFYLTAVGLMDLGDVAAIHQAVPLTVTLGAVLVFGERIGPVRIGAILVGLVGVLLIIRPGQSAFTPASLLVLGSVVAVTIRDLAARGLSRDVPSVLVARVAAVGVTLLGFAGSAFVDWQWPGLSGTIYLLGAAGFLIFGYLGTVAAVRVGEIGAVAPFRYTGLLAAIVLGVAMFGTWPDAWTWAGAALVVGAGIVAILRDAGAHRRAEAARVDSLAGDL